MKTKVEEIEEKISELKKKLTGDMFKDMEVKDEIHKQEMKLKGVTPNKGNDITCIGCGS